ncbi:MAG: hypothetical protein AB1416_04685 [Actinomycetota bacterium]
MKLRSGYVLVPLLSGIAYTVVMALTSTSETAGGRIILGALPSLGVTGVMSLLGAYGWIKGPVLRPLCWVAVLMLLLWLYYLGRLALAGVDT